MPKKEIVTIKDLARPPSPFNHVVKAGGFLFLSSQLSVDLKTHTLLPGTVSEQTTQALENIKLLLEASDSSLANVVRMAVYMRDVSKFEEMNRVYRTYFPSPNEPARVTIQAASPLPGIDIEIEVTAV